MLAIKQRVWTAMCLLLPIFPSFGLAQEPHILSEEVQRFASEVGLAEELGIDWTDASAEDIARYVHVLTATDIVAAERAGKERPSFEDYQAAAYILCRIDLPNMPKKPPKLADYGSAFDAAYLSQRKQNAIRTAMGPLAYGAFPEEIRGKLGLRPTFEEYSQNLFDFEATAGQEE